MKIQFIHIIVISLIIMTGTGPYLSAAGEMSLGIYMGLTQDSNNLENEINEYNSAMEQYKTANADTEVVQLNVPYELITGITIDYTFNMFLLKAGVYFSRAYVYPTMGSLKPASASRNTIRFNSYQVLVPFTAGFTFPFGKRTFMYWGAGISILYTSVEMTQSAPNAAYNLPANSAKESFSDTCTAFHFVIGAEIPLSESISLSSEWMHITGNSDYVKSSQSTQKRSIDITNDIVLFGFKYYFVL